LILEVEPFFLGTVEGSLCPRNPQIQNKRVKNERKMPDLGPSPDFEKRIIVSGINRSATPLIPKDVPLT